MVYILSLNNNGEYEDFTEWIEGVFSTKNKAVEIGMERTLKYQEGGAVPFIVEEFEIDADKPHIILKIHQEETGQWIERII